MHGSVFICWAEQAYTAEGRSSLRGRISGVCWPGQGAGSEQIYGVHVDGHVDGKQVTERLAGTDGNPASGANPEITWKFRQVAKRVIKPDLADPIHPLSMVVAALHTNTD